MARTAHFYLLLASKENIKRYRRNGDVLLELGPLEYNIVRYPERPYLRDILDDLMEFSAYEIITEEEYRYIRVHLFQTLRKLHASELR